MFRTENPRSPSAFPFRFHGNKPSSSPASKTLIHRSRTFEEDLIRRLKALIPGADQPSITFSWLSKAVDLLSAVHSDAESLISDLTVSASEKSLALYLDDSVKVLDICNSISSEIERLRQKRLLVNFVLHLLRRSGDGEPLPSADILKKARESLADFYTSSTENKRLTLEKSAVFISDLAGGLSTSPRGKSSSVEKLLHRTIYAVGAVTVFVTGVVVSVLSGSSDLTKIPVSGEFVWAGAFNDLQTAVGNLFSGNKTRSIVEKEEFEACVRSLSDVIADVGGDSSEGGTERLGNAVNDLDKVTGDLSNGLEGLLNGVNGFFRSVLCTRNTLLKSFRVSS